MSALHLHNRIRLTGQIIFQTAFHLGSGDKGDNASDMGLLMDINGDPLLPGSSLKGVFRSTTERLCHHLGHRSCFLERDADCPGGNQKLGDAQLKALAKAQTSGEMDDILQAQCDTCQLFGSSLGKGRLYFQDAACLSWAGAIELRDGVGIDRDSGTAVNGVKYDYDVVPKGATFAFTLLGENLTSAQERLLHITLLEWQREVRLGGMTSRGLGIAALTNIKYEKVDLSDPAQRVEYLIEDTMQEIELEQIKKELRQSLQA